MNNLPSELLIEIFSHTSYWDLKYTLTATCKRFHILILDNSALSRKLFKDVPLTPGKHDAREEYNLHPALCQIFISPILNMYTHPEMFFIHDDEVNPTVRLLKDTDVGGENVISPAVTTATLELLYADGGLLSREIKSIREDKGISVQELLDEFVKLAKDRKQICLWSQNVGIEVRESDGKVKVAVEVFTAMDDDEYEGCGEFEVYNFGGSCC